MPVILEFKGYFDKVDKIKSLMKTKSLGVARRSMPQIYSGDIQDFFKYLKDDYGISVKKEKAQVGKLKPTQKEYDPQKVLSLVDAPDNVTKKPIIVSKDNRVLDGTHRWLSLYVKDESDTMPVYRVDAPIRVLLDVAKDYDKVSFKKVKESVEQ